MPQSTAKPLREKPNLRLELVDMANFEPPDAEEVEKEVRYLFPYGFIKKTAQYARIPVDTLYKQLNPQNPTQSIVYEFLMLLYGAECAREGLGEALWQMVAKHRARRPAVETASTTALETAFFNFRALLAAREDGRATAEEVEAAREKMMETAATVGRGRIGEAQAS